MLDRTAPLPLPEWERWCAQAAIAGNGVVLVSVVLVADALAEGLLVMPFEQPLAGDAYDFVCAPELESRADVRHLRDWFQQSLRTE